MFAFARFAQGARLARARTGAAIASVTLRHACIRTVAAATDTAVDEGVAVSQAVAGQVFGIHVIAIEQRQAWRFGQHLFAAALHGHLHVVAPDGQRQRPPGGIAQAFRLVVAEPDDGHEARGIACEPGVIRIVRRSRLAGRVTAPERQSTASRAALDDVAQHAVHDVGIARGDDLRAWYRLALGAWCRIAEQHCAAAAAHFLDQFRRHLHAAIGEHGIRLRQLQRRDGARAQRQRQGDGIARAFKAEARGVVLHVAGTGRLHQADGHQVFRAHQAAPHADEAFIVVAVIARTPGARARFLRQQQALRIVHGGAGEISLFQRRRIHEGFEAGTRLAVCLRGVVVVVAVEIEAARHGDDFAAVCIDGNERAFHLGQLAHQPAFFRRIVHHADHAVFNDGALAIPLQLAAQARIRGGEHNLVAIAQLRRQLTLARRPDLAHQRSA